MLRARRVFHAVLVEKLDTDGALTVPEMTGRIGWFDITLDDRELDQLVASAARHGVIAPLENAGPHLPGEDKGTRWIPTQAGLALPFPAGSSAKDLRSLAPATLERMRTGVLAWSTAVVTLIAALGLATSVVSEKRLVAAFLFFAFAALICVSAVSAERDLGAAANAWPRFKDTYPRRWEWQTKELRSETLLGGSLIAAGFFIAAVAAWSFASYAFVLAGLVAAASTWLYFHRRIRPLRDAWLAEWRARNHS